VAAVGLVLAGPTARASGTSSGATPSVDVVKVTGVIDPSEAAYIRGTVQEAERAGATVILQIDSRGSFGDQAEHLSTFLRSVSVPVIGWVGPAGARAEGGALLLLYSSSLAAMAPGAGVGPGRPFDLGTRASLEAPADVAAATRRLEALAPGAGVRADGVRAAVSRALPAGPARAAGAVSLVAPDVPTLLQDLDGRSVRTTGGAETLATVSKPGRPVDVRFHEIGPIRRTLHAVSTPTAVYVLLVLGLWGIAFECTQPGFGMAGIGGLLALALAGYGLAVIPVHWAGVVVLLAGVGLQGLDVLVKRLAWFTAAGTVLFLAGSLVAWWGVAPAVDLSLWLPILMTVGGLLLFAFGMTVALQARERVRSQQVGLVGLTGEARGDIDPEGAVVVKGAVWRARSNDGPIPKGTRIRVRGLDGLILRVEPEPD